MFELLPTYMGDEVGGGDAGIVMDEFSPKSEEDIEHKPRKAPAFPPPFSPPAGPPLGRYETRMDEEEGEQNPNSEKPTDIPPSITVVVEAGNTGMCALASVVEMRKISPVPDFIPQQPEGPKAA